MFVAALQRITEHGGDAIMVLTLPGTPRGEQMRLAGRRGPLCRVLCCPTSGGTTVQIEARKVADWLHKTGLVVVEPLPCKAELHDSCCRVVDQVGAVLVHPQGVEAPE